MRGRKHLRNEGAALKIQKRKVHVLTMVLVLVGLLVFGVSAAAADCEQHDFGSPNVYVYVYAPGRTWNFTAENNMAVRSLEVKSVTKNIYHPEIGGYFPLYVEIKVNDTLVTPSWELFSADFKTHIHSASVEFNLNVGDEITFHIYGGTSSLAAGIITGPNYVKLCEAGLPTISISPTSVDFSLDVIDSMPSPGPNPSGLAFDGTYLWHADATEDKIYKLDTSGNIVDSFDSPDDNPKGLTFDGTYLWNADDKYDFRSKIYKLDTSGNIIDSFNSPSSRPSGLTFDGTYLWNADNNTDKIYKLDTSGNIVDSFDSPARYSGDLAFDGTYLFVVGNWDHKIHKLDTSGNIITSFDTPSAIYGLTFDGTYFWYSDGVEDKIYKIMILPVYVGLSRTQIFTVTNSGTADLVIGTLSITGANASEFSIENDNCSNQTITPLGTCTCDVVFAPTSEGKKSANLGIPSNDPETPTLNVPLSGTAAFGGVDLTLTPDSTTVPRGGTLGFQITITNNTDKAGTIRFATKVTLPNGNPYPPSGYLFGPKEVTLNPYQSKSGHLSHTIPMGAPLGPYIYHGYIGRPGMGIIDEDQFDFEVVESPAVIGPEDWQTIVDQEFTE